MAIASRFWVFARRSMRISLTAVLLLAAVQVAPASATETTVGCAGLQRALEGAGEGDKVLLDELCTSGFPYRLPATQMTLAGTPGAGFDGGSTVQLEGSGGAPTIEGLLFENAHSSGTLKGGALSLNVAPAASTITLAHDSFVNNTAQEGEGGGARINTGAAAVIVRDSTFTGNRATVSGGGLVIYGRSANLSGDTFTNNSVTGPVAIGGGLYASTVEGPIALSGSQFTGNSAAGSGGGAVLETETGEPVGLTITDNTFSHNSIADPAGTIRDPQSYLGGGLLLRGTSTVAIDAVQIGNTFDANSVSFRAAPVSAWGGGESTVHISLQSTDDRFTNNALQSPSEARNGRSEKVFGWGAGLSVAECGEASEEPPRGPNVVSTLTDAVVAGNTLQSGPSANGAGIYVGFVCPSAYTTLQLLNSTVSGNQVSGASGPVAGISGGPHDVLSLTNTILAGDGGPELGGFQGLSAVSATFSDICSGTAAFTGTGNICADPLLANPKPGNADVHETAASPTLERGSNGLIPTGLSTDVYGAARIQGPPGCATAPTPVVDIGAAEYTYPLPPCAPNTNGQPSAPVLSNLTQSARRWREGKQLAKISTTHRRARKRRLPVGTTFSFGLNQAAQVTFTFTQALGGRKVGKRCLVPSHRNRHKRRCIRVLVAGRLVFSGHAGTNRVAFQGVISKHKRLKPGKYKLLATAVTAGKSSRTRTLSFMIAR